MAILLRILKWTAIGVVTIAVLAAIAYPFRRDPIGPLAGKQLTGDVVEERVTDWSFSDDHTLIAVETRIDDPHSVTTICFTLDGDLYVPARGGAEKDWTGYVADDPRVRVKIGDRVYPGRAVRIEDESLRPALIEAAGQKYEQLRESNREGDGPTFEDVWLFRIESSAGPA